jgi:hypothetical protein
VRQYEQTEQSLLVTEPQRPEQHAPLPVAPPRAAPKRILDLLRAAHPASLSAEELRVRLHITASISYALSRMVYAGLLVRDGVGHQVRYRVCTPHIAARLAVPVDEEEML